MNHSIKSWIDDNQEQKEKCYIQLKKISTLCAEATDKKLSVRQLREELEGGGYIVSKLNGEYSLKNWRLKRDQIEQNNDDKNLYLEEE